MKERFFCVWNGVCGWRLVDAVCTVTSRPMEDVNGHTGAECEALECPHWLRNNDVTLFGKLRSETGTCDWSRAHIPDVPV